VRAYLLVTLLVSIVATSASAQPAPRWVAYLGGEVGVQVGSKAFTDRYAAVGFGGGAGIGAVLTPLVTVTAHVQYTLVELDGDGFIRAENQTPDGLGLPSDTTVNGATAHIVYTSVGVRLDFTPRKVGIRLKPYVLGGIGWYYVFRDEFTLSSSSIGIVPAESDWESALGLNGGGGVEMPITEVVNAFVEGQFRIGFTNEMTATIPLRAGLAFLLGEGR
jgi:hypothetical protein